MNNMDEAVEIFLVEENSTGTGPAIHIFDQDNQAGRKLDNPVLPARDRP